MLIKRARLKQIVVIKTTEGAKIGKIENINRRTKTLLVRIAEGVFSRNVDKVKAVDLDRVLVSFENKRTNTWENLNFMITLC